MLNPTDETIVHLEIGDRSVGDSVSYPDGNVLCLFWAGEARKNPPCTLKD